MNISPLQRTDYDDEARAVCFTRDAKYIYPVHNTDSAEKEGLLGTRVNRMGIRRNWRNKY
jgi:hypothetical protein